MRAPHFVLAALVALATSFSLHAFARHRHYGWQGRDGWRYSPLNRFGGPWGHHSGWGFRHHEDDETRFGADAPTRQDYGPHSPQPSGPTPLPPGPALAPVDSITPLR